MASLEYFFTKILNGCIVILFLFVTIILTLSVVTRFIQPHMPEGINIQLPWAEEAIKYAVLWICWLGSAVVLREKGHFALNLLTRKFPDIKIFPILIMIVTVFIAGLFIYYGVIVCINLQIQKSPSLQISKIYINMVVPITGIFMVFYAISGTLKK